MTSASVAVLALIRAAQNLRAAQARLAHKRAEYNAALAALKRAWAGK